MVSTVIWNGQNSFDIHDTEGWEFSKQITQAFYLELFTSPCALVRWLQGHRLPFYPIQDNSAVSKQSLRVAITISMQLHKTWEIHTPLCKFWSVLSSQDNIVIFITNPVMLIMMMATPAAEGGGSSLWC